MTEFKADGSGRLAAIVVSTPVPAEEFRSTLDPGIGPAQAAITMHGDPAIASRLLRYLQSLEANLAFSSGALERVHWDTPKQERIPETAEEKTFVAVSRVGLSFRDPRPKVVLLPDAASAIVSASLKEDDYLVVHKAFWREAMNEHADRRYIQAFYNFYFVIEGLFGNGKFKEAELLRVFRQSPEMTGLTRWALKSVQSDPYHWRNLFKFYSKLGCNADEEGTQCLLVRLRGSLHHYSIKSTKRQIQPSPLSQDEFHSPAWLAMHFATRAIETRDSDLPHAKPIRN